MVKNVKCVCWAEGSMAERAGDVAPHQSLGRSVPVAATGLTAELLSTRQVTSTLLELSK